MGTFHILIIKKPAEGFLIKSSPPENVSLAPRSFSWLHQDEEDKERKDSLGATTKPEERAEGHQPPFD